MDLRIFQASLATSHLFTSLKMFLLIPSNNAFKALEFPRANASGALGKKMSDEKLVRKILRSLPKRFAMKVIAIEESQDICKMRVDELIGSIQTLELGMSDGSKKKDKSIAFMSNTEEKEEESGQDTDEDLENDVALLGRQFNKLLKKMDVWSKSNVKNISSDISKSKEGK